MTFLFLSSISPSPSVGTLERRSGDVEPGGRQGLTTLTQSLKGGNRMNCEGTPSLEVHISSARNNKARPGFITLPQSGTRRQVKQQEVFLLLRFSLSTLTDTPTLSNDSQGL